jgi:hypothetical protein
LEVKNKFLHILGDLWLQRVKSYNICFVFHVFSVSRQCKIGKAGFKVVCEEVQTTFVFRITDGLSRNVAVVCGTTAYVFINYTIADKKGQWIEVCDGM